MILHSPLNVELVLSVLLLLHSLVQTLPVPPVSSQTLHLQVVFTLVMLVSSVHLCWPIQRVPVVTSQLFHCSLMNSSRMPCSIWVEPTLAIPSLARAATRSPWTSTDIAVTRTLVSMAISPIMSLSINLICHHRRTVTSLTHVLPTNNTINTLKLNTLQTNTVITQLLLGVM